MSAKFRSFQVPICPTPTIRFEGHPLFQGAAQIHANGVKIGSETSVIKSFAAQTAAFLLFGIKIPRLNSDYFNFTFFKIAKLDQKIRNQFVTKIPTEVIRLVKDLEIR